MASGVNRASGVLIRGIQTSSENLVAPSQLNVAYTWAMDGIRFCDLGAIEDAVTPSEALNIGRVDVLFLPVGGSQKFHRRKTPINDRPASSANHCPDRYGEWPSRAVERGSHQRESVHAYRVAAADDNDRLRAVLSVKGSS